MKKVLESNPKATSAPRRAGTTGIYTYVCMICVQCICIVYVSYNMHIWCYGAVI